MLIASTLLASALAFPTQPPQADREAKGAFEALVADALRESLNEQIVRTPQTNGAAPAPPSDVELRGVTGRMTGCSPMRATVATPLQRSGRISVRVDGVRDDGAPCASFIAADILLFDDIAVTTSAIAEGELVEGQVRFERMERVGAPRGLVRGELATGGRAVRPVPVGTILRSSDVAHGPRLGATVRVVVRSGSIRIEQTAQVTQCPSQSGAMPGLVCATLRSGKRVSGIVDDAGVLAVQSSGGFTLAEVR